MKSTSKENNYEPRAFLETEIENSARKYIYIYAKMNFAKRWLSRKFKMSLFQGNIYLLKSSIETLEKDKKYV